MMSIVPRLLLLLSAVCFTSICHADEKPAASEFPKGEWVSLFNGKDLTGWTPKIRYCKLGENFENTFRVEDGMLKVRYDGPGYSKFGERFGHLFYKDSFSNYRFRVEYRFVDKQCTEGPGWATRNSGVMVHGQDPATMTDDQDFPVSIEVQLLGGNGKDKRTTSNLCTPGTNVVMGGELKLQHCMNSSSKPAIGWPTSHCAQVWMPANTDSASAAAVGWSAQ